MEHHEGKDNDVIGTQEAEKASVVEFLQLLETSEKDLSVSEVNQRLQKHGYNEITEKKEIAHGWH